MKKLKLYVLGAAVLFGGLPVFASEAEVDEVPNVLVVQEQVSAEGAAATEAYIIPLVIVQIPRTAQGDVDSAQMAQEVKKYRLVAKKIKIDSIPAEALSFFNETEAPAGSKNDKLPNWGFYVNLGGGSVGVNFGLFGRGYDNYYGYRPGGYNGYWGYRHQNRYRYYNPYGPWYYKSAKGSVRQTIYVME